MGFGGNQANQSSASTPTSAAGIPPSLRGGRGDIARYFANIFNQGSTALSTPQGILGPLYQNLFGQNGGEDFLGARAALQRSLSGQGYGENIASAYQQLLPTTMRGIADAQSALATGAGPQGLRFSTDLIGQQGLAATRGIEGAQERAATLGGTITSDQGRNALGFANLIGGLGQAQNPLEQALRYFTSFPGAVGPTYSSGGSQGLDLKFS